ncbi:phage tail sheath family protein [Bradyrhizobium sp. McL0616]|uniref:phage tail sheath family protein n=1 Tax=Bradyrhizobium sp. McL0616 TaxID=3415674 RepID=UPI003CEF381B
MPITPTFPGIYIQEAPSSSHTVIAASTNTAVFIGYTHPLKTDPSLFGKATEIFGFMDYQRQFGGFVRSAAFANQAYDVNDADDNVGDLATAVNQFFLNGGLTAYIVALQVSADTSPPGALEGATITVGGVSFVQREITDQIYTLKVQVSPVGTTNGVADVIITYSGANSALPSLKPPVQVETYRQVNLTANDPNNIATRINAASSLVRIPTATTLPASFTADQEPFLPLLDQNATFFNPTDFIAVLQQDTSLDKIPVINLMVLPGVTESLVISTAIAFCERKLAFLILDPKVTDSADGSLLPAFPDLVEKTVGDPSQPRSKNAALYFPYLLSSDPVSGNTKNLVTATPYEIPPAATVAGIFAATDISRGVWKAPAGFQAGTKNTLGVVERGKMTDARQGVLNPLAVNCLRDFPNVGTIVFGSRTLDTTEQQWTYVPVRRMALFLEQTFYASLKWVIFEPNDEPLWSAIRMSLNAFMLGLFKQGAFQGSTPSEAFNVQCDNQTTTQADIDAGVVNIVVSFAPLKPAEFVIITIAQLAGQTQTS